MRHHQHRCLWLQSFDLQAENVQQHTVLVGCRPANWNHHHCHSYRFTSHFPWLPLAPVLNLLGEQRECAGQTPPRDSASALSYARVLKVVVGGGGGGGESAAAEDLTNRRCCRGQKGVARRAASFEFRASNAKICALASGSCALTPQCHYCTATACHYRATLLVLALGDVMTQCLICLVGLPHTIRFSPRLVVERFHSRAHQASAQSLQCAA